MHQLYLTRFSGSGTVEVSCEGFRFQSWGDEVLAVVSFCSFAGCLEEFMECAIDLAVELDGKRVKCRGKWMFVFTAQSDGEL